MGGGDAFKVLFAFVQAQDPATAGVQGVAAWWRPRVRLRFLPSHLQPIQCAGRPLPLLLLLLSLLLLALLLCTVCLCVSGHAGTGPDRLGAVSRQGRGRVTRPCSHPWPRKAIGGLRKTTE